MAGSAAAYIDGLNPEQRPRRRARRTGTWSFCPLLVIAGAGSGKTNTLAHRVAHLIVNGADPPHLDDDVFAPGSLR
jgi:DNA helicase II / ATP-dependent DNA helicase PcrA